MTSAQKPAKSLGEHREGFDARNKDLKPNEGNKGWEEILQPMDSALRLDEVMRFIHDHHATVPLTLFRHYCRAISQAYGKQHVPIRRSLELLSRQLGYHCYNQLIDLARSNSEVVVNKTHNPNSFDSREFYFGQTHSGVRFIKLVPIGSDMTGNILLDHTVDSLAEKKKSEYSLSEVPEIKAVVDKMPEISLAEFLKIRKLLSKILVANDVKGFNPGAILLDWLGQPNINGFNENGIVRNLKYTRKKKIGDQ